MKVVIAGVTGFIGGEILKQCIKDAAITHIYTLSRRHPPSEISSLTKVTSIQLEDFLVYPESVLEQLSGVEACFWTIGVKKTGAPEWLRMIDIGYSQAAAKAFADHLQPLLPPPKKFRFIHLSGVMAEKDPARALWFLGDGRRSKGEAEIAMLRFAKENEAVFDAFVVRPGMVLNSVNALGMNATFWEWLWPSAFINVEHLTLCMIALAKEGGSGTVENAAAVEKGRMALSRTS